MIWFLCKQCNKTHGRPETAVGTLVFCECGQGNTVPWESTAAEPPMIEEVLLPTPPRLDPMRFEPEQVPDVPGRRKDKDRPRPKRRPRDPKICLNHEDQATQEPCTDCGEGFCGDCLVFVQGKPLCGPCKNFRVRALHEPLPVSQMALVSFLLGLFTGPLAFCLFPMGVSFGAGKLSLIALIPQLTAVVLGAAALRWLNRDPKMGGQSLAVSGILTGGLAAFWTVFVTYYAARLWV